MRTPKARARWARGALVGASSAVVTVGAHAGTGAGLPHGSALVLTLLLCTTVGALAGSIRAEGRAAGWAATTAALGVAQLLGHAALAVAGHHPAGFDAVPAPAMIAAHAVAAVSLGVAISAAEYLYVVCSSVLCWLHLFTGPAPRPVPRVRRRGTKVVAIRPVLVTGLGMRAPPSTLAAV
ncbi:hypothetical protein PDG61_18905 [Mycolicibacterium sp. BiH015]|uniref:hypothetical protein n=1 Tax=Mycolicibacterium sp. BiH015 TaxID=3018808 RepID=UPI0022E6F86C|nr:hypothetical protein [Mycolicibacterium sp. BiH015]MDA2892998.1 hypothetical protein [Mycolicibacterium sp. BiH015]